MGIIIVSASSRYCGLKRSPNVKSLEQYLPFPKFCWRVSRIEPGWRDSHQLPDGLFENSSSLFLTSFQHLQEFSPFSCASVLLFCSKRRCAPSTEFPQMRRGAFCKPGSPSEAQAATSAVTIVHILQGSWGTWEAWICVDFS